MINLPDYNLKWEHENNFYLSCDVSRMRKVYAHFELFRKSMELPGDIVEFGVFKGASFIRFAIMRELFGLKFVKKLIGFDSFGEFPNTAFDADGIHLKKFIEQGGNQSISVEQMLEVLRKKEIIMPDKDPLQSGIELVSGNILLTLPDYLKKHSEIRFSFINLDTDVYEPAQCILECCWDRMVSGGILLLDDYTVFPGETTAVDEFFHDKNIKINTLFYTNTPCYIIKP